MKAPDPKAQPPEMSAAIPLTAPKGATLTVIDGRKDTALAISIPRDRHYKTLIGYYLSADCREQLLAALLKWRYVEDELPEEETRVMLARRNCEELEFGGFSKGKFHNDDGAYFDSSCDPVYAWAHVPAVPAERGGAK